MADYERNFVKYSGPAYDKSFTKRQLTDPALLSEVRAEIADTLLYGATDAAIDQIQQRLLREFKRTGEISPERELQIARLLVQAAHPAVIMLLLLEKVNVFVSYSHNIADLMGVHFWEREGQSGGLQMVSGDGTAVYVSCGGNPFITKEEQKTFTTDGFPALARLMVIAAQEMGHYADLQRNAWGQIVGRHSAYLQPLQPTNEARQARLSDLYQVAMLQQRAVDWGLLQAVEMDRQALFYRKHRPGMAWWQRRRAAWLAAQLRHKAQRHGQPFFVDFPTDLAGHEAWATNLFHCLKDMRFNLAPDADVYRRADPVEEEAIACIEALARVPQQVIKWGHAATRGAWPNLYQIYYHQVVPHVIQSVELLTGQTYRLAVSDSPAGSPSKWVRNLMKR